MALSNAAASLRMPESHTLWSLIKGNVRAFQGAGTARNMHFIGVFGRISSGGSGDVGLRTLRLFRPLEQRQVQ